MSPTRLSTPPPTGFLPLNSSSLSRYHPFSLPPATCLGHPIFSLTPYFFYCDRHLWVSLPLLLFFFFSCNGKRAVGLFFFWRLGGFSLECQFFFPPRDVDESCRFPSLHWPKVLSFLLHSSHARSMRLLVSPPPNVPSFLFLRRKLMMVWYCQECITFFLSSNGLQAILFTP